MMKMKRLLITLAIAVLAAGSLWAKDDEVIVTRQLSTGQRDALPEKTVTVEMKKLTFSDKSDPSLVHAIFRVMDTIAAEDYQNRTFVLMLESKGQDEYVVAAKSDDIVTQGKQDATIYYGDVEYKRYHFVVLTGKDNKPLLETTFKRQGKVKFVQEFEFVDFKTPNYPTSVICKVVSGKIPQLQTVAINQEPDLDSDWFY